MFQVRIELALHGVKTNHGLQRSSIILYIFKSRMSSNQPNFNIRVNSPPKDGRVSPKFGDKKVHEAIENVGKHGKSHHQYMKIMALHKPVAEMRKISQAQLEEHSHAESAWLSLGGIVYDVTVYLHYHPGGDIILKGCGKQCSALFNTYHPWVNSKHLLSKYAIGYLGP